MDPESGGLWRPRHLRRSLARSEVNVVAAVESYNYELQLLLASQERGLTLAPERILQASRLRPRLQIIRVAGLAVPVHHLVGSPRLGGAGAAGR